MIPTLGINHTTAFSCLSLKIFQRLGATITLGVNLTN